MSANVPSAIQIVRPEITSQAAYKLDDYVRVLILQLIR